MKLNTPDHRSHAQKPEAATGEPESAQVVKQLAQLHDFRKSDDFAIDTCADAISVISRLKAQRDELMAACKELREASAACLRVFAAWQQLARLGIYDPIKEIENELASIGLDDGWGKRAQAAIAKVEGGKQ